MRRLERGLGVRVDSPIVPVIVGAEADALKAAGDLLSLGYHVPAIRPPTVQPGTCRSAKSAHSLDHCRCSAACADSFQGYAKNLWEDL